MPTVRIESILGGQSPTSHFGRADQFRASLGIDPSEPLADGTAATAIVASGLLRPSSSTKMSGSNLTNAPLWIEPEPKAGYLYVYDYAGSAYVIDPNFAGITGLSDGGALSSSTGNGMAYYDNYIYFARSTDIARYGPLNGTAAFTGTYWTGTLGKTALTNTTTYPTDTGIGVRYPNHVMHRHSDGRLYVADVVGNKGALHYIATTKTSVEGDTDNGSTYLALQFGYGLHPTAIESYGSDLVVALYEGIGGALTESRAKIAFWDTTSQNYNKIIWVEFPDQYISAMKNVNGVLYVASGRCNANGFRVTRFVGGYTMEEVGFFESGTMPFPDAMDGVAHQLVFGTYTYTPDTAGCLYSLGLQKRLSTGVFNLMRTSLSSGISAVTSVFIADNWGLSTLAPVIGWSTGSSGGTNNGIDTKSGYGSSASVWWSQMYRIGQPFKITKIRIPLAQAVSTNMTLVPKVYTDDGAGTTTTLTTVNNTNYPSERNIVYRPENLTGQHNFWLELTWSGTSLMTVGLPITIEYELIDD